MPLLADRQLFSCSPSPLCSRGPAQSGHVHSGLSDAPGCFLLHMYNKPSPPPYLGAVMSFYLCIIFYSWPPFSHVFYSVVAMCPKRLSINKYSFLLTTLSGMWQPGCIYSPQGLERELSGSSGYSSPPVRRLSEVVKFADCWEIGLQKSGFLWGHPPLESWLASASPLKAVLEAQDSGGFWRFGRRNWFNYSGASLDLFIFSNTWYFILLGFPP